MADNNDPTQISDILELLQTANKSLESTVFVPSKNAEVKTKPLNANHTKNIIKSTMNGPFASNQFTLIMYNILKEVLGCPVSELTVYDKTFVLLQLRSRNISDEVEMTLESKEKTEPIKHKVCLSKLITKLKKAVPPMLPRIIELENYQLTLNYPSVEEEYQFENNLFRTKLSTIKEDDQKAMRELIAPIFLYQISQYVKEINIGGKAIDLTKRNVSERLAIVESLSANAINEIMKAIDDSFGKDLSSLTKIEITRDDVKYSGTLEVGAPLFISN